MVIWRRLERGLDIAVSACLVVSFFVGFSRVESTLLGLWLGCRCGRRCREYWRRQSNNIVVRRPHHRACKVAKALAIGEWQTPDVPDDMWDSFFGIELSNAVNYQMIAVVAERYRPLCIRTSPFCCLLTRFTRVPHYDRINEERPVEGV